jgi:hypothetical protein
MLATGKEVEDKLQMSIIELMDFIKEYFREVTKL